MARAYQAKPTGMDTIRLHSDTVLSTTPIHCTRLPQRRLVVAMGAFDGVHLGHQALIRDVQSVAQQEGLLSGVVTFEPHPQLALHPERGLRLISDSREQEIDRKSTRLNSSHANISYAVFCLKKKKNKQ